MATFTAHYSWNIPSPNADDDVWGTELNGTIVAIDAKVFDLEGRVPAFTSVQQGGGTGQGANKVYIGWDTSALRAQVDAYDLGEIPTANVARGFVRIASSTVQPTITYSSGAPTGGADDDLWFQWS